MEDTKEKRESDKKKCINDGAPYVILWFFASYHSYLHPSNGTLKDFRYTQGQTDHTLFIKHTSDKKAILVCILIISK